MNEKGFTLIEIIGVITIIGFLLILVLPNILNSFYNQKDRDNSYNEVNDRLIIETARMYVEDHPNTYKKQEGNNYCIKLTVLTASGVLNPNFTAIDNMLGDYSNHAVKVTYTSGHFEFELKDNTSCN